MPDQQLESRPYTYAEVRSVAMQTAEAAEPASFEVSSTASVPSALLTSARSEAAAAGFAAGWAQGLRQAREAMAQDVLDSQQQARAQDDERRARLQVALASLDRAAQALAEQAQQGAEELEGVLAGLGVELAEALLQREVNESATTARDALARAIRFTHDKAPVTVYLSPADHETLTAHPPVDYPGRTITLEADPALVSGDAVAVSGVTRVDARLSEAIARVRAVLST